MWILIVNSVSALLRLQQFRLGGGGGGGGGHPIGVHVQPGAVKLVLWHHWMHEIQVHPVTPENMHQTVHYACKTHPVDA